MTAEAIMTRDEERERYLAARRATLIEDALHRGADPFETLSDWHSPGLFGSDEEVDEFNASIEAERARFR
jgi:hypothetical protein